MTINDDRSIKLCMIEKNYFSGGSRTGQSSGEATSFLPSNRTPSIRWGQDDGDDHHGHEEDGDDLDDGDGVDGDDSVGGDDEFCQEASPET